MSRKTMSLRVWLEQEGYRVLRFWNAEAFDNIDGVLDTIYAALYGALDAEPAPFTPRQTAARPPVTPPRATLLRDPPPRGEGENGAFQENAETKMIMKGLKRRIPHPPLEGEGRREATGWGGRPRDAPPP